MLANDSIYYGDRLISENDYLPKAVRAANSSVIETLNNTDNRNLVMSELLRKTPIQWFGSWYLYRTHPNHGGSDEIQEHQLQSILEPIKHLQRPTAFTIAVTRGIQYAHFTSFIVIPQDDTWSVLTFDSGSGIYRGGQLIQELVLDNLDKHVNNYSVLDLTVRRIPPDTDGITDPWDPICQHVGSMQCTGDPFCQTWSLLFIYLIAQNQNFNFISNWEGASADQRLRIIHQFILDLFVTFPELEVVANKQMQGKGYSEDVYDLLSNYYGLTGKPLN